MHIDIVDQRKGGPALEIDTMLVREYCGMAGIDLEKAEGTLKIRFRSGEGSRDAGAVGVPGRLGYTKPVAGGYRVVVNVRYSKPALSESASYVVSNTLLHELRHVGQGLEVGWAGLSGDYHGWSETEAREHGRLIQGMPEMYAVR